MQNHKIPAFLAVAICCITCWGCTKSVAVNPTAKPSKGDFETKQAALKELPPTNAISLKQEHSIKKGEGARFIYPSSMVTDKDGNILIADNNGHAIDLYSAKTNELSVLPTPTGDGALLFPLAVRKAKQEIYVAVFLSSM